MAIEFELKFRGTAESIQQMNRAVSGETMEFAMETTYYDGVNGQLSAKKYTLRRRMENEISVCTLKTPAGDNRRGEWEVECEDIHKAIDLLVQIGAPEDLKALPPKKYLRPPRRESPELTEQPEPTELQPEPWQAHKP